MFCCGHHLKIGNKSSVKPITPEDTFGNVVKLDDGYHLVKEDSSRVTTYSFINSEGFVCNYKDLPARIKVTCGYLCKSIQVKSIVNLGCKTSFLCLENRNDKGELMKDSQYPTLIYMKKGQYKVTRQQRQLAAVSNGVVTNTTYGESKIHKIIKNVAKLYNDKQQEVMNMSCCGKLNSIPWYYKIRILAFVGVATIVPIVVPSIVAIGTSYYFSK